MGFMDVHLGLSENVVYPEKTNGFADHYPYEKWLFHWGYTQFSDIPSWRNSDFTQHLKSLGKFGSTKTLWDHSDFDKSLGKLMKHLWDTSTNIWHVSNHGRTWSQPTIEVKNLKNPDLTIAMCRGPIRIIASAKVKQLACLLLCLSMFIHPLVNIRIAIENGPVEIVDLPIENCDFPYSYVNVYQRVCRNLCLSMWFHVYMCHTHVL